MLQLPDPRALDIINFVNEDHEDDVMAAKASKIDRLIDDCYFYIDRHVEAYDAACRIAELMEGVCCSITCLRDARTLLVVSSEIEQRFAQCEEIMHNDPVATHIMSNVSGNMMVVVPEDLRRIKITNLLSEGVLLLKGVSCDVMGADFEYEATVTERVLVIGHWNDGLPDGK